MKKIKPDNKKKKQYKKMKQSFRWEIIKWILPDLILCNQQTWCERAEHVRAALLSLYLQWAHAAFEEFHLKTMNI